MINDPESYISLRIAEPKIYPQDIILISYPFTILIDNIEISHN